MTYCSKCGCPMDENDKFCPRCGWKKQTDDTRSHTCGEQTYAEKESKEKLCCELAYSGTLFWLPLLICPKEKMTKFCANQGLWALILSVLACWIIQIAEAVNSIFAGTLIGVVSGGIYSLLFLVFLFFMVYLFINCVRSALAIHRGEKPGAILFFDKFAIIK